MLLFYTDQERREFMASPSIGLDQKTKLEKFSDFDQENIIDAAIFGVSLVFFVKPLEQVQPLGKCYEVRSRLMLFQLMRSFIDRRGSIFREVKKMGMDKTTSEIKHHLVQFVRATQLSY